MKEQIIYISVTEITEIYGICSRTARKRISEIEELVRKGRYKKLYAMKPPVIRTGKGTQVLNVVFGFHLANLAEDMRCKKGMPPISLEEMLS